MSKEKSERLKKGISKYRYPILFVLLCIFFASVPYADDDVRWGSAAYGLERLKTGFQGYGGRYLGYLIILILTRSAVLKTIYMSAVTSGVVYLTEKLSKKKIAFYITLFAVVSMPLAMFNNTISWVSGFVNYMTSILLTFIYVRSLYDLIEQNTGEVEQKWVLVIPYALLGFSNALIVEHFTLLNIALWFAGMLYAGIRKKRVYVKHVAYGIGLFLGTALMFSNSAYGGVMGQTDFYRTVKISVYNYMRNYILVCEWGFFGSFFLNLLLVFLVYRIYQCEKKHLSDRRRKFYMIGMAVLGLYVLFEGMSAWIQGPANREGPADLFLTHTIATTLFFIALLVVVGIIAIHKKYILELALPVCSMLSTAAVFVIISPVTPRCLLGSYFFELLLIYMLMNLVPDLDKTRKEIAKKLLRGGIVVGFGIYFVILSVISLAEHNRVAEIRRQVAEGKKEITIEHIPYEKYVHSITPNPEYKFTIKGYKSFYHIPQNVKIQVEEDTNTYIENLKTQMKK